MESAQYERYAGADGSTREAGLADDVHAMRACAHEFQNHTWTIKAWTKKAPTHWATLSWLSTNASGTNASGAFLPNMLSAARQR